MVVTVELLVVGEKSLNSSRSRIHVIIHSCTCITVVVKRHNRIFCHLLSVFFCCVSLVKIRPRTQAGEQKPKFCFHVAVEVDTT